MSQPQDSSLPGSAQKNSSIARHSLALQFFDQNIEFQSHSPELHTTLTHMYQRFRSPNTHPSFTKHPPIIIQQQFLNSTLGTPEYNVSVFEASRLQRAYATSVRTKILIHAGALAYENQGVLLVAPSMHGKTTLTLKLVHDGFGFLSDDVAPLAFDEGLDDGLVYPFPRSFVIREGSVKMAGFSPLPPATPTWLGKQIIDAEALQAGCIGQAVPVRHIFFLHGDPQHINEKVAQENKDRSYKILIPNLPDELKKALLAVDGIEQITVDEYAGQMRLSIVAKNKFTALREIDILCESRGMEVIYFGEEPPSKRNFDGPAGLTHIPQSKAVLQLLDQFLGGYHSALMQNEMGNSPIRLSMALARIIKNAACYRLRVGPLQEMADLVRQTVTTN